MSADGLWAPVAGKYGRTRDGRKVGPMMSCPGRTAPFQALHPCSVVNFYHADGKRVGNEGSHVSDLVSEWIDDPAPAQPIDFSKIKVGDKVRLGGEFEVCNVDSNGWQLAVSAYQRGYTLTSDMILAHIPAVCPIEVGCLVVGDCLPCARPHRVLAVADGQAWVKIGHSQTITALADLTRIDGEPA